MAAIGILGILYGLLLNLLPILATIYISAKVLGWLLFEWGILTHGPNYWFVQHLAGYGIVAVLIAALGVLLVAVERLHDVYRSPREELTDFARAWAIRLFVSTTVFALAFLPVPRSCTCSAPRASTSNQRVSPRCTGGQFRINRGVVALVRAASGSSNKAAERLRASGTVATWTKRCAGWRPGPVRYRPAC